MKDGRIVAEGTPAEVGTAQVVRDVFDVDAQIITDPVSGSPLVVPLSGGRAEAAVPATVSPREGGPT